tara:strand:+ start:19994 stop:20137 length:144 start_codon:yes stop_codon:yes gene_type:complete
MKTQANINQFLNLKFHIIEALKAQGCRPNWIYPCLKGLNIHEMHFQK